MTRLWQAVYTREYIPLEMETASMAISRLASEPRYIKTANQFSNLRGKSKELTEAFSPAYLNDFEQDSVQVDRDHPGLRVDDSLRAVYDSRNQTQAAKNPSIKCVLDDPAEFFKSLEERFEAQKVINPQDPYDFDISDYGLPVLEDIESALGEEIELLQSKSPLARTAEESGTLAAKAGNIYQSLTALVFRGRSRKLKTGLKFLNELRTDVQGHLEQGEIGYKRLNEIGYFASRALGHFDREDLSSFDRNFLRVDRALLGYQPVGIEQEYQRYKDNDFQFFRRRSPVPSTDLVADTFTEAYQNKEKFELASLPVARSLGPGVFMQLVPHDIYLMGVSKEPEAADGFNRPGGDFYLHDARHSSAIFTKRKLYEKHHNVSPEQQAKLEMLQSKWKQEMIEAKKEIDDKELRYAIGMLSFNHHHDRGIPQMPSSFIPESPGTPSKALYRALKWSGQPIGFQKPNRTLDKAYAWLRDFWLERLPEEDAVLAASRSVAS